MCTQQGLRSAWAFTQCYQAWHNIWSFAFTRVHSKDSANAQAHIPLRLANASFCRFCCALVHIIFLSYLNLCTDAKFLIFCHLKNQQILAKWIQKSVCQHPVHRGGSTNIPTSAIDGAGTVQSGCRPRIMSFNRAITVNGTFVIAFRPSWYCSRLARSTAFFSMRGNWSAPSTSTA